MNNSFIRIFTIFEALHKAKSISQPNPLSPILSYPLVILCGSSFPKLSFHLTLCLHGFLLPVLHWNFIFGVHLLFDKIARCPLRHYLLIFINFIDFLLYFSFDFIKLILTWSFHIWTFTRKDLLEWILMPKIYAMRILF